MLTEKDVRKVYKRMREKDDSHLWPINGRFNVTELAIRRTRRAMRYGLFIESPEALEAVVENEISKIVNDSRNW